MDRDLNIDWSKFKSKAKGKNLEKAKNAYIEFCRILDEVGFELVSDYIGNKDKVELVYKLDNNIKLNIKPNGFKTQTYKTIINFKKQLKINNDEFIKFIGLTDGNSLMVRIKTFDGGLVEIDISNYNSWNKGRKDFYNKLKEVKGYAKDYYINNESKMNICIDGAKLNPINPNQFKTYTYKSVINFKNNLTKNNDKIVRFVGLTDNGSLMAKIKTYDDGMVELDIRAYCRWNKSRQNTYDYCKKNGYKILSSYIGVKDKILIDFDCGHQSHWIIPSHLKQNCGCPICNESKGEKAIRLYLKNNNIEFIQEYKFNDCRYKRNLPFDFYIQEYNLCIEFDGRQHFEADNYFGGEKEFKDIKIRDEIKDNYCKENGVNLLRISYYEIDNMESILNEEFDRLRELKMS